MPSTINLVEDPNYYAMLYNDNKNDRRIKILDSTLREGEQHPGVSFTVKQRVQIAWMLDYFGVDQIEISPVISKDHEEATKIIIKAGLNADIVTHGRAIKQDVDIALRCDASWMATYMGISDVHLRSKLKIGKEEALMRAIEVVDYIKTHGLKCRFTLEDASRTDPEYIKLLVKELSNAKVDRISIPDTVGIMLPRGMYNLVKMVKDVVNTPIDVHCHNDLGLALANALAGIDAGAEQIHTTINGIGERNGIPTLAEVAVVLTLLYKSNNNFRLNMLKDLSKLIEQYTGLKTPESKPLVGDSAFKHKAGTHLAAVLREPESYEIINPKSVGNRRRLVFGELAGKNGALFLLNLLGLDGDVRDAEKLSHGLKGLRMGDILEIYLDDELEQRIIKRE